MKKRSIKINGRKVGPHSPSYIIAEIGSNFDGSKNRAKKLIADAAECGADAAKFQAFKAEKIVSQEGFAGMKEGFQSDWDQPVYEVYKEAELPREWLPELKRCAQEEGIDFLCTPYDREAVEQLEEIDVPAYKIGSGDITWVDFLKNIAALEKPVLLSTGASTIEDIDRAVRNIMQTGNSRLALMQCVTNYPSDFESANIRAMETLQQAFEVPVGYSDHTPGSVVPLGAISRGGCLIEKHFTDDKTRSGPDHSFAMNLDEFSDMVQSIRRLESALGSRRIHLYDEEKTTVVLQRRCLRATSYIEAGTTLSEKHIEALRPAPTDSIEPWQRSSVLGCTPKYDLEEGEHITWNHFKS